MKKIICFLLTAIMALGFVSCQNSEPENRTLATEGATETEGVTENATSFETNQETIAETATQANTETETETETEPEEEVDMCYPKEGEKIILANDEVYSWWSTYKYTKTDSNPYYRHEDIYYPKSLTFSWKADENATYYKLYLSTSDGFTPDETESYLVNTNSLTLNHLYVGTTYYWRVYKAEITVDGTEKVAAIMDVHSFKTADSPRCFEIEGVSNTRDIGGIDAAYGYRIKQHFRRFGCTQLFS